MSMKLVWSVALLVGMGEAATMSKMAAFSASMYESGEVMSMIMMSKEEQWAKLEAEGRFNSAMYPAVDKVVPCVNGLATAIPGNASYTFRCNNIDLYDFQPHSAMGSKMGQGSSSWGWTSPEGREFIAIGQADGAAFAEITKDGKISYLGRLPPTPGARPVIWREIRGFHDYMIIGSESVNHFVQVFDMKKLLDLSPSSPKTFDPKTDITSLFKGLPKGKTHNVVTNEAANMVYSVGAEPRNGACKAGLIFIDMKDPANPTSPGCAAAEGYVHDAQCTVYKGPDAQYVGREICYGFNERNLVIYDVTEKTAPKVISKTSYQGVAYCHQGWVLDPTNQEYLIMDDEYDEVLRSNPTRDARPTTYIWNIKSLAKPVMTGYFKGKTNSVDHNQYIYNQISYQSNYGSGLRVLDLKSIPTDPTGKGVEEIGFFDMYPEDDKSTGGGRPSFVGTWSSFGGFKSGYIFVNSIERGGFVVKIKDTAARSAL